MRAVFISHQDLTGASNRLVRRPVHEVMSRPVLCVGDQLPLGEALMIMVRGGVRHLVVVDEHGRCLGVLSDRAIAAAWAANPGALALRSVVSVLDDPPALVGQDATVVDAARVMRDGGVDAVAVVNTVGVAVGILTGTDMIGLLAK